jgi:hypothetical protein
MGGEVMVSVGESESETMLRVAKEEGWIDFAIKMGIDAGIQDPIVIIIAKNAFHLLPKPLTDAGTRQNEKLFRIQKRIGSPLFAVLTYDFSIIEKVYSRDEETIDYLRRVTGDLVMVVTPDGAITKEV